MTQFRSTIPVAFSNLDIYAFWDSEEGSATKDDYKQFLDVAPSKRSFEEDAGISGFSTAPLKQEGAPFAYDTATQTYLTRYQHYTYANGFQITQEAKEDNIALNMVQRFIPALKNSMYNTVNIVGANLLNNGFSDTTVTGDGVALLSASHPTRAGNQSNILATPADLTYTSCTDLITLVMKTKDDRGKVAALQAKKLILPIDLWKVGTTIMQTAGAPGVANNDTNAILAYGGLFSDGMCTNHFLTDTNAWFIKTDATEGLRYFDRIPVSLEEVPSIVSAAGDSAVRARVRFSVGASNWRAVAGTAGSS